MSRPEVARALSAMDDESTRKNIAVGDFSSVEPIDLTDDERDLVKDAAGDYPEVAGFNFSNWMSESLRASKAAPKKIALEQAYIQKAPGTRYEVAARWAAGS